MPTATRVTNVAPRSVWCCECGFETHAELVTGAFVYPHRPNLRALLFWRCPACGNYVGCHKGGDGMQPLGSIPGPELRAGRQRVHRLIDPLWKQGYIKRTALYKEMGNATGMVEFHTAELRNMAQVETALVAANQIRAHINAPAR